MSDNNTKPQPPKDLARPDMAEKPTVILGAGPAGLTAGYLLAKKGLPVVVLEAENQVGGIAKTAVRDGYRFEFRVSPNRAAVPNSFAVRITKNGAPVRNADVTTTFAMLDADGDGRISASEFQELMGQIGVTFTDDKAAEAIEMMDADGDGLVTLEELATYMSTPGGGQPDDA